MNRQITNVTRRDFLRIVGAAAAGSFLASGAACTTMPAAPPADRPNILWITCEDMSPNLGCYGDTYARTPTIDRLAEESVRYTNVFATAPVCSPARSAHRD